MFGHYLKFIGLDVLLNDDIQKLFIIIFVVDIFETQCCVEEKKTFLYLLFLVKNLIKKTTTDHRF